KAAIAQEYCKNNKMNTDFCLLFDARIHSGKNRLVIWDFKKDSIVGIGKTSFQGAPKAGAGAYRKGNG
ncbi:hypothetical protein JYT14_00665, partial [Flavobacteriales bacterium AH-315-E23]|nr:hypothetical protein [Flavobacteriales bacterium AH-315-E23]